MSGRFQRFATAICLVPLFACDQAPTAPATPADASEALTITSTTGDRNAQLLLGDSVVISVTVADGKPVDSEITWKVVSGREVIGIRRLGPTTALIKTFAPGGAMIQATTSAGSGVFAVGVRLPQEIPFIWTADDGMQPIPLPAGVSYARVTAINNRGEVVGSLNTSQGQQAFVWSKATGFNAITEPRLGEHAVATAINNLGVVVGVLTIEWDRSFVFSWSPADGFRPMGLDGASPHAINDAGQVVGGFYPSNESVLRERAFLWQLGEKGITELREGSVATDISNSGHVVGYNEVSGTGVAAIAWSTSTLAPSAIFEPLDLMGCDLGSPTLWGSEKHCEGEAASVNEAGEVAGTRINKAFRWTAGSGLKLLELSESRASWGRGINAAGDVVGHALTSPRNAPRPIHEAFIWRSTGEIMKLGKLPGTAISVAVAVNDHGMVIGYAR